MRWITRAVTNGPFGRTMAVWVFVVAGLSAGSAGSAGASQLECPSGARLIAGRGVDGSWAWCEAHGLNGESIRHGPSMTWHPNGRVASVEEWDDDRRHGLYGVWHPNGQQAISGGYVKGNKHGQWRAWFANGRRRFSRSYSGGRLHGPVTVWFARGAVAQRGRAVAGLESGVWESYYANGGRRERTRYKAGRRHGRWVRWSRDGAVLSEVTCLHGQCDRGAGSPAVATSRAGQ